MITIKEVKKIREQLNLSQIIIFGVDKYGREHVATHGRSKKDAIKIAEMGNSLKKKLKWPENLCDAEPLKRICGNCSFWQNSYCRPQGENSNIGKCMYRPGVEKRLEEDIACIHMEPNI